MLDNQEMCYSKSSYRSQVFFPVLHIKATCSFWNLNVNRRKEKKICFSSRIDFIGMKVLPIIVDLTNGNKPQVHAHGIYIKSLTPPKKNNNPNKSVGSSI